MDLIFLKIVNISIAGSWLVLAALALRLIMRKAPKAIMCLLWLLVAIRLVCPFSMESRLSLLPGPETIPAAILYERPPQAQAQAAPDMAVDTVPPAPYTPAIGVSKDRMQILSVFGSLLWLAGMALLLAYGLASFLRLRHQVATAVRLKDNIWQSEAVTSPFILGLLRPRIYLPFKLGADEMSHILSHELAHIRRGDHLWKPLGFLILAVHWFNPLVWLAYILLSRDLELACDEKAIRDLSREQRAAYSAALLRLSLGQKKIALSPLAFGGLGVQERVNKVINYQKPGLWVVVLAIVVIAVAGGCLLTDPQEAELPVAPLEEAGQASAVVWASAEAHVQSQMLMGGKEGAQVWQDWRITELSLLAPYQLGGRMFDLYRLNYERQAVDLDLVIPMALNSAVVSEDNWVSNNVVYYLLYDAEQGRVFGQPLAVQTGPGGKRFKDDMNYFLPYWSAQEAAQDHLLAQEDRETLESIDNFANPEVRRKHPPYGADSLSQVSYITEDYQASGPIYAVTFAGADPITLYVDEEAVVFAVAD